MHPGLLLIVLLNSAPPPPIARCQQPQATETFVLSEAALLLNSFPEGSEVILECGRGYEKESGSGAIVCTNGEWSKPNLICKGKCQLPSFLKQFLFCIKWIYYCQLEMLCLIHRDGLWAAKI